MSSPVFTNRQRSMMYRTKGEPTLALEFDVFPDGQCSMWAHTRHDVPFATMQAAFQAVLAHLQSFIADGEVCPFNPDFMAQAGTPGGSDGPQDL